MDIAGPEIAAAGRSGADAREAAVRRARERGMRLPTIAQLAGHEAIPDPIYQRLQDVDPQAPDPLNLWRVHWRNAAGGRGHCDVPEHLVLPGELTGADCPIVVLLGENFPMIGAHKVLPAYAGLVTLLVSGGFDVERHRAIWPSTGNYCRGGVAISRILGCDGIAVLPEGMSRERYAWLERWVSDPSHIVRTYGTESNVKEIYDKCNELAESEENIILNQFSAFSNYMVHYACTGTAAESVIQHVRTRDADARPVAFVSATGSAGTIAAGDYLKKRYGTRIAAVEALECPTMLEGGYGEHNIQGIGDKHIPLIHNVMNTDFVIGISDEATDRLNVVFNSDDSRPRLAAALGIDEDLAGALPSLGISGLANVAASIRLARNMNYGAQDIVVTIATDNAGLYVTEQQSARERYFPEGIGDDDIVRTVEDFLRARDDWNVVETTARDRRRIFNLGYYTWVEQQGVSVEEFDRRRDQSFWNGVADSAERWDEEIRAFNADAGFTEE